MKAVGRSPIFFVGLIFFILPLFLPLIGGYTDLGTEIMIMAIYALAFNMLLGFTGLMSFGHGAYFGTGAYFLAFTQLYLTQNVWIGILFGMLAGGLATFLVGLVIIRKSGIYFSLLTVAFTQVFFTIGMRWTEVTGGENGLRIGSYAIGSLDLKEPLTLYYFVFAFFLFTMVVLNKITKSPVGRIMKANKYNRDRTMALGYNIYRYRLFALTLSGLFSGLAGALSTIRIHAAFAEPMNWFASGDVVMMTILGGGLTNFFGPILGAAIFTTLQDLISTVTIHWMFIFGLLFVSVILFMPGGIMGFLMEEDQKGGQAMWIRILRLVGLKLGRQKPKKGEIISS